MKQINDIEISKEVGADTEEKTLTFAKRLRDRAKKARTDVFDRMEENVKYYEGDQWGGQSMPSYRAKIVDNRCFSNVESVLPIITDNRPKADIAANHPADVGIVNQLADVYDAKYDDLDLELLTVLAEKDCCTLSEGYWKVWFNPTLKGGLGDLDVSLVSPYFIFPDPESSHPLLKDAQYVVYEAPDTLGSVMAQYPDSAAKLKRKLTKEADLADDRKAGDAVETRSASIVHDSAGDDSGTRYHKIGSQVYESRVLVTEIWLNDLTMDAYSPDYIYYFDTQETIEYSEEGEQAAISSGRDYEIINAKDLPKVGLEDATKYLRRYPNGRIITYCEDVLLRDEASPYQHGRCPYVRFFRYTVPTKNYFYGEIDQIKPLQRELNKRKSQIIDIMTLTCNPPIVTSLTSGLDTTKLTNAPGSVWSVMGDVNAAVKWLQVPNIPAALFMQLETVNRDIDTVSGIHDVTQGRKPTGVTAGVAIESLQEAAQTRIRLAARYLEYSLKHAAELMISIIWQYYRGDDRIIKKRNNKLPSGWQFTPINFKNAELQGDMPDIRIESGSTMPINESVRRQQALSLWQSGAIDRPALLDIFDWPNADEIIARMGEGNPFSGGGGAK